jgi:hypothetical protein
MLRIRIQHFRLNTDPDPNSSYRRSFGPQKRISSTSKREISELFSVSVGHFCPPGSRSTDLIGSGSNPDPKNQCCGSMTFWWGSGSGSADPYLWLMDLYPESDPDPAIFITDLQDANKKLILKKLFCILLFEGTFTSFFKNKKVKKKSQSQGFSYYFCLMQGSRRIWIRPDP